ASTCTRHTTVLGRRRRSSGRAALRAPFRVATAAAVAAAVAALAGCGGSKPRSQWSIFEAPHALVGSGPEVRERTLDEIHELGSHTLRVQVIWSAPAPSPDAAARPAGFDPADPSDYPGFEPYDDLVRTATAKGFRVLMGLAPQAPRWATEDAEGAGEQAN